MRRRTLPWLLCALALCAAAAAAAAPAGKTLERLMALLAQRRHSEVTFVERDYLSVLTRPLESSGVLVYDAPDHLEKRTLKPHRATLVIDHGVLSAHRGNRTYHIDLSAYPRIAPYIDAITNTLAGNRAALERRFKVGLQGTLAHWTLTLRPRDGRASPILSIRIEGSRAQIRSIEVRKTHGGYSHMTLGAAPPR